MERRRITFSGHVQGVGFRATARHAAASYAVSGWVRNEADGSVLMEIQGEPADIDACLVDLRSRLGRFIHDEHAEVIARVPEEAGFLIRR